MLDYEDWQPNCIPLPEVLLATGHARSSVGVVLGYYDLLDNRQGEIARLVAGALGAVALRPPRHGLVVDSRVMSRDSTP